MRTGDHPRSLQERARAEETRSRAFVFTPQKMVGQVPNLSYPNAGRTGWEPVLPFSLFQGVAKRHEGLLRKCSATCRGCAASAWGELRKPRNLGRLRYPRRRFS